MTIALPFVLGDGRPLARIAGGAITGTSAPRAASPLVQTSTWAEGLVVRRSAGAVYLAGTMNFRTMNFADVFADANFRPYLAKYNADLTLDRSFGTGGISFVDDFRAAAGVPTVRDWEATDVCVLASGSILVAFIYYYYTGMSYMFGFGVFKFNSDGTLDPTFANGGAGNSGGRGMFLYFPTASTYWARVHLAERSDGSIVVASNRIVGNEPYANVLCLNADGTLNTAFATSGVREFYTYLCYSVTVLANDDLVVCGSYGSDATTASSASKMWAAKIDAAGALDTSFATGGHALITFPNGYAEATNILQQGASLVLTGNAAHDGAGHRSFALARIDAGGALDASFGTSGLVATSSGNLSDDVISGQGCFFDGSQIVLSGYTASSITKNFYDPTAQGMLARYSANGVPDLAFGVNGFLLVPWLDGDATANEETYGACLGNVPGQYLFSCHFDASTSRAARAGVGEVLNSAFKTTLPAAGVAPIVTTGAASALSGTTATANATVNPGGNATDWCFAYGLASGRYAFKTATAAAGSGSSPVGVSANLTGLTSGQTYYGRAAAWSDAGGLALGGEISFTTA